MGWWQSEGRLWGDEPADIFGKAIDEISAAFGREWNRPPTRDELRAGLMFSEGGFCTCTPEQAATGPCGKPARQAIHCDGCEGGYTGSGPCRGVSQ